jgi:mannitol 2-dehydrogenase
VLNDNRADELRRLARENPRDPRPVLGVRRVFGDLGEREGWVNELTAAIQELDAHGARASVVAALSSSGQPA